MDNYKDRLDKIEAQRRRDNLGLAERFAALEQQIDVLKILMVATLVLAGPALAVSVGGR